MEPPASSPHLHLPASNGRKTSVKRCISPCSDANQTDRQMGMKGYVNSNKRKNTDPGKFLIINFIPYQVNFPDFPRPLREN